MDEEIEKEFDMTIGKTLVVVIVLIVIVTGVMGILYYGLVNGTGPSQDPVPFRSIILTNWTNTTATLFVSSAPDGAMVEGTQFSFDHDNAIALLDKITIYNGAGMAVAILEPYSNWLYLNDTSADTLEYRPGMKILVENYEGISIGDSITISSSEGYFGVTEFTVS